MKMKLTLLLLACFVISSCSKWHYGHGHDDDDGGGDDITYIDSEIAEGGPDDKVPKIELSPNQIIVRYESFADKESIRLEFPFLEPPRGCSCGDTNIELWTIDTDILDIEGTVRNLKSRGAEEGVEGDRGFSIFLSPVDDFQPLNEQGDPNPLVETSTTNTVNIAVIDTGLDFSRDLVPSPRDPYLFKDDFSTCYPESTGWNFANNSSNITDYNGHGTYVTKIITDILDGQNINYRILPLTVFDINGRGSYWDVVCAMGYIKDINSNGGNIKLVNASFGGQMNREVLENGTVLSGIIEDLQNETLIVSSAGNGNPGVDNDNGPMGHFLSSYLSNNILTVGGYEDLSDEGDGSELRVNEHSNYGGSSIDVALEFGGYEAILNTDLENVRSRKFLKGTSYSAAAMTGLAAEFYIMSGMPDVQGLKNNIFAFSRTRSGLNNQIVANRAIIRE